MTYLIALVLAQEPLRYHYGEKMSFVYDVKQTHKTVDDSEESTTLEIWTFSFAEPLAGGAAKLNVEKVTTGMIVDGNRIEIRAIPHRSKQDHSPRGDVRNREPSNQIDPSFELRLLRIRDIEYPSTTLAAGTEWRRDSKPTNDGLSGALWIYKATDVKGGKLVGTFSCKEMEVQKPIQAEGTFCMSTKDGWPIELAFKAINTHQLGDEEKLPTVYSFSMKRR